MTDAEFAKFYENRELKTYLWKIANAKTHDPELKEDCLQEAWVRISEAAPGQPISFYQGEGYKAINACCEKQRRYKLKQERLEKEPELQRRKGPVEEWSGYYASDLRKLDEATYRRILRIKKKYKKNKTKRRRIAVSAWLYR